MIARCLLGFLVILISTVLKIIYCTWAVWILAPILVVHIIPFCMKNLIMKIDLQGFEPHTQNNCMYRLYRPLRIPCMTKKYWIYFFSNYQSKEQNQMKILKQDFLPFMWTMAFFRLNFNFKSSSSLCLHQGHMVISRKKEGKNKSCKQAGD